MTNLGKFCYDAIPIPTELEKIIQNVVHRVEREMWRRRIIRGIACTAVVFLLLFGCANIAPIYEKGVDIPVFGTIVRILHIGSCGK